MNERTSRKTQIGMVISDKMDKTIVVEITRRLPHPMYKKIISRKSRIKAHDETNQCQTGDKVRVMECRPLSKDKAWRLVEIMQKVK